jgi:sugar phosphate isomerase/epimerase
MYVGILTGPFSGEPLEVVAAFAGQYGFGGLELATGPGSKHIDTNNFDEKAADAVKTLMEKRNLQISGLAAYTNVTDGDPERRKKNIQTVHNAIDAASLLDIEVDCAQVFPPLIEYAAEKNIKLAMENWTATNIQNLAHWERIFEVLPQPNFGLNFDPSHLHWQDIDYIEAVDRFGKRIFHSHGKDTEIKTHRKRIVGNQGSGWWRYVIPGLGQIRWGEYISALRRNGYNGVISIEHEDDALEREEGFLIGKKYLEQFLAY